MVFVGVAITEKIAGQATPAYLQGTRMTFRTLRRLYPEHPLHLGLAPPDRPGAPEELFADPDRAHWLGVANSGHVQDLLADYRIEMGCAVQRGIPVVLALQSHADALEAEAWLALLRPDWQLRYSLELVDAFEASGMIPGLAALADAA
jgi:hypothetical protein